MTTTVWYADGPNAPRVSPRDAVRLAGLVDDGPPDVTLGWTIERHPWIEDPTFTARTVLAGYGLSRAVNDGRITPLPVRLSAVPALIETTPPDVAVVGGVRRGSSIVFSTAVGWADVLARTARAVVVEVDDDGIDLGGPEIIGSIVATVPRPPSASTAAASRPADEIDLRIGALVASLLPDEPTLQFGPGGVGEGIARALTRPVHIWSGLVTDQMAELHSRGLLLGPVVAAYAWGGEPIRALAAAGMLRLCSSTVTHDLTRLSSTPRLVGCNTALQVGLDGAVNVERVGRRIIAAVGGHADFCVAASRSVGGMSMIALRSTAANGSSAIVPSVDVVSTPRADIQVVVTEHGIADLRGVSDDERARRLIEIAAPEHRTTLRGAFEQAAR
ncbi:MAG: acetyl-CoA hydrolase/transferase C-terminal domain-containing protein [Acidimicrobiia bacterium]